MKIASVRMFHRSPLLENEKTGYYKPGWKAVQERISASVIRDLTSCMREVCSRTSLTWLRT